MIAGMKSNLTEEQIAQIGKEIVKMHTTAEVELWIGKDDYFLRRLDQKSSEGAGIHGVQSSTISFFDLNQPVIIDAPLDDE
jgi:hypothetical protein